MYIADMPIIERHENVSSNADGPIGTIIETHLKDDGTTERIVIGTGAMTAPEPVAELEPSAEEPEPEPVETEEPEAEAPKASKEKAKK